ncbi:glutamate/gamma-aminobutyrate antiporter [Photobacterium sp. SKA34]|uniref:hypothetical protein n=1 Tax=Photobacterium sp. SKA34 TaxID=121723 RepID=UPI00006ACBAD|nr:hypothetical protein [Photobacterium sp. SKA34]EAR53492.1 glutamate/gamma-aminobutyrate antiporter [Photobacterium sp. SKA34]
MWFVSGVGFVGSLTAFIFSFIPPGQISVGSPQEYVGILVVLTIIFVSVPLFIYKARKPHWKDPAVTDFAPFTWEIENVHPGVINPSDKITHTLNQ